MTVEELNEHNKVLDKAYEAEKRIINYADTLITAFNEQIANEGLQIGVPEPHPCSIKTASVPDDQLDKDYNELINCCQRHVCRLEGYCKSSKPGFINKCRFGYPFEIQAVTRIEFHETPNSVKAEICHMRNDPYMNVHCRPAAHAWRGNMDMQLILDHHAAVNYMVKYATKSEKAGNSFKQLYNDIIGTATEEDNPQSKLRSLMLRSIAGKRDLGQCEISRLLLSEPLYHSSFNYVNLCTDLNNKQVNLDKNSNEEDSAVKESIIDFYANRFDNPRLQNQLDDVHNLIDFVRKFTIKNKELVARDNSDQTVIITFPKVNFSNFV